MKRNFVFTIIFLTSLNLVNAKNIFQKFDKASFYSLMASGGIEAIDYQLNIINDVPVNERSGYEGALLMKKASLAKKPKDKLSYFKAGRIKMETALLADDNNVEFHFLRLAIQEHAPKIVKYRADIPKDKLLIINKFKNLSPAVQHAILDYCKNSKVLRQEDF